MYKNILKKENLIILFTIILFILLFFNYLTNCFHIIKMDWFNTWQLDSNSLIKGRIYAIEHFGWNYKAWLMQGSDGCAMGYFDPTTIRTYTSQLGLGGSFWGLIHAITHSFTFCEQLNVFLFCIIVFYILKWIYDEFGLIPASIGYLAFFISRWVVASARNLYWMPFLFLLPFVTSLYILKKEEQTGKLSYPIWLFLIYITIFIKAGCGFEMITSTLINSVLPIFYYAYKNKWGFKKAFLRFFVVGLSGMLAFLSVIALHIYQLYIYFDYSWTEALNLFQNDIARRTAAISATSELSDVYTASLKASKLSVLKAYFISGKSIIFGFKMYVITIIYSMFIILSVFIQKFKAIIKNDLNKLYALEILTILSLLGPISWYVLASPHSYIHTHINYMLWSYPALVLILVNIIYIVIILFNIIELPHTHSSLTLWNKSSPKSQSQRDFDTYQTKR